MSILNAHCVKYLAVGAYAGAIHAQPRATKDLDILVKADAENAKAVFSALAKFGAPRQGLTSADFEKPGPFFRMGREPVAVDILTAARSHPATAGRAVAAPVLPLQETRGAFSYYGTVTRRHMPLPRALLDRVPGELLRLGKLLPRFQDGRIDYTNARRAPVLDCYVFAITAC